MKTLIYKPTQNRKTQEIINDILNKIRVKYKHNFYR